MSSILNMETFLALMWLPSPPFLFISRLFSWSFIFLFPHFTHCYLNIFHLYFLLRLPWPRVAKYLFLKLKINLFFSEESGYKSTSMLSLLSDELQVLNSDITFIFIAIIFSVLVCFNLSYFFKVGFCFLNRIQFYDSFAPYTQYVAFVYFSSFILISQSPCQLSLYL